jgi:hypothetical protein
VQRARQFFHQDFPGFVGDFNGSGEIVFGHRGNWQLSEVSFCVVRDGFLHFTIGGKPTSLAEGCSARGAYIPYRKDGYQKKEVASGPRQKELKSRCATCSGAFQAGNLEIPPLTYLSVTI